MSGPFTAFLSKLFGREELSDCLIVFYPESAELAPSRHGCGQARDAGGEPPLKRQKIDGLSLSSLKLVSLQISTATAGSKPMDQSAIESSGRLVTVTLNPVFGDPLPAHLLVVYGGCPRFRAQVDRWRGEKRPDSKPVLRVPLRSIEELPHALSAIRFIYEGKVAENSASQLLHIRRQAAYLQVDGCVEACDKALLDRVNGLAGVAEVYGCRHLLPDPEQTEEPNSVEFCSQVLRICRQQLVKHSGVATPAGGPNLGELLAWSFRDAPSVLSDPETRRQMEALPAAAMEALLGSQHFAADDEATVLLMLARWLEVNTGTSEEGRKRLCKLVRLCHLSSTYLFQVLPLLLWFPLSIQEHRFLCSFAAAVKAQQERMAGMTAGTYDCSSPWYAAPARPPLPASAAKRSYSWYVKVTDLAAGLASQAQGTFLNLGVSFSNGSSRVAAFGMEWYAGLNYKKGSQAAGLYLYCSLPTSLKAPGSVMSAVNPGPVRLVAYKWREDGSREEAWSLTYSDIYVEVGIARGTSEALKLAAPSAGGQEPSSAAAGGSGSLLAPWCAYLKDGKLQGVLEWV